MTVLADVWASLEHPIVATVAAALILGAIGLAWRGTSKALRTIRAMGEWVLPHFQPQADEHGRLDDEHTLPARVTALSDQFTTLDGRLTSHMEDEAEITRQVFDRLNRIDGGDSK